MSKIYPTKEYKWIYDINLWGYQQSNLWDAFVNHIENTYFPGASEVLDKQLIALKKIFAEIIYVKGLWHSFAKTIINRYNM